VAADCGTKPPCALTFENLCLARELAVWVFCVVHLVPVTTQTKEKEKEKKSSFGLCQHDNITVSPCITTQERERGKTHKKIKKKNKKKKKKKITRKRKEKRRVHWKEGRHTKK